MDKRTALIMIDMQRIGVQLLHSKDFISHRVQIYDSLGRARALLN